jgi:hypothetical protein
MKTLDAFFSMFSNLIPLRYGVQYAEELPDSINKKIIYLLGNKQNTWCLVFECPCGCKNTIHLNTLKETRPYWKYEIKKRLAITISPSVNRIIGCRSHFFIRNGKVLWYKK